MNAILGFLIGYDIAMGAYLVYLWWEDRKGRK